MRAPSALATSSTASLPVSFSRSRIGFTSTTSSESSSPDSRDELEREVRLAVGEPAAHRRADARREHRVDGVEVEADVQERRAGEERERLAQDALDAEPVDLAHREDAHVELADQLALARVERADADERGARRPTGSGRRRSRTPVRRRRAPRRAACRARCRSARSPAGSGRRARRSRARRPAPRALAIPPSVPIAIEWSPPSTSGMCPRSRRVDERGDLLADLHDRRRGSGRSRHPRRSPRARASRRRPSRRPRGRAPRRRAFSSA